MTDTFMLTGTIHDRHDRPVKDAVLVVAARPGVTSDSEADRTYTSHTAVTTNADGQLCVKDAEAVGVPLIAVGQYEIRGVVAGVVPHVLFDAPAAGSTLDVADLVPAPGDLPATWATTIDEIDVRLDALEAGGGGTGGGGGPVAWASITDKPATFPPTTHGHDDRYYTETETDTLLAGKQAAGSYATPSDVAGASTADRARANHTGTQPSTSISDFTEAVQDAVAALLSAGTGVTLAYDDAGNSLSITATGSGGLDAEAVRDAIGVALIGSGAISVVANDAGDTITISTTATQNSTDAQLRDRGTHTGTQSLDTTTDSATRLALTAAERTKLGDVATGATANATDAQLRDRSTHTGTQASTTITGLGTAATVNTGTASGDVPVLGTGGRLAIARVASGTPDGTKFVRDDGTLATPAGGGGGSLSAATATLATDVTFAQNTLTDVLSISLGVGTWLVSVTATIGSSAQFNLDLLLGVGTATATFAGVQNTSGMTTSARSVNISLDSLVTVTAAGTIVMRVQGSGTGGFVRAATQLTSGPSATGITALKIA